MVSKKTSKKKKATAKKKLVKKTTVTKKKTKPLAKSSKAKKTSKKTATKTKIYKALFKVGDKITDFSLPMTGGKDFKLSHYKDKNIVLYFYPKDATPGCTLEGHDFSQLNTQFNKSNTLVFGVSRDSITSHEKFKEKQNYKVELISDEDEKLCEYFAVIKMKKLYGREYRGLDRSTFVIDKKGKLVKEWREVKVKGHAEEVLNFVKTL